jgi:microcystin-dependent protein
MATISFKTTFDLSLTPKQFIFEDLSDYIGQGIAEADVNGCIKEIISPSGIPYYTNADFSDAGCDIQVAVDRVSKIVIPLPQTGGVVEAGDYTITYRVYNKDTDEYYEITNTYTYTYVPKTITITQDADCLSPRFTSTDTTDYGIDGAELTLIRQHVIDFPYGSAGEGSPISGPLATYSTSVFYNGTQTTEIGSSLQYVFEDGLVVKDYLTGVKEILVACEDTCAIMCCIKAAWTRLKGYATTNRTEYNLLLPIFNLAVSDLVLLMRSQSCGMADDMSQYLSDIKTLLNCTDDCCTESDTPTQVIGLGNINIVVVESGDAVVEVEAVVAGTTTTYTITLAEAFVAKVNALWSSIVAAGQNITSVTVVTNPDGTKTYTVNGKTVIVAAGIGVAVSASAEVNGVITYTVSADLGEGDNIDLTGAHPLVINGKKAIVVAGPGVTVTPSAEVAGVITYTVEVSAATLAATSPVGGIMLYGGAAAPTGWLLCQGQSLVRTDYADLFTAIGVVFGSADGTHFNLPDLRSRVPVGVGQLQNADAREDLVSNYALGDKGGINKYNLLGAESGTSVHNHTGTLSGDTSEETTGITLSNGVNATDSGYFTQAAAGNGEIDVTANPTVNDPGHTHDISSASVTINDAAAADAAASHENRMPYVALNYIIKT